MVAESFEPGARVTVVAKRYEVRPQQVHAWRRDAREGRLVLPMDTQVFAPIVTTPGPRPRGPTTPIEVEFSGARCGCRSTVSMASRRLGSTAPITVPASFPSFTISIA
ncbi:MAG: transposase [Bradyrhizobium guangdongense]